MPQSADAHRDGKQSSVPESRLQCAIDERDGFCDDDLSAGVHVPRNSTVADVHEVRKVAPFPPWVIADDLFSLLSYPSCAEQLLLAPTPWVAFDELWEAVYALTEIIPADSSSVYQPRS